MFVLLCVHTREPSGVDGPGLSLGLSLTPPAACRPVWTLGSREDGECPRRGHAGGGVVISDPQPRLRPRPGGEAAFPRSQLTDCAAGAGAALDLGDREISAGLSVSIKRFPGSQPFEVADSSVITDSPTAAQPHGSGRSFLSGLLGVEGAGTVCGCRGRPAVGPVPTGLLKGDTLARPSADQ